MSFSLSPHEIGERLGVSVYPESMAQQGGVTCLLAEGKTAEDLLLLADKQNRALERFEGSFETWNDQLVLKRCPANEGNASALRDLLPGLKPVLLGLRTSVGFGDRLGLATTGHVLALRRTDPNGCLAPIFAQQSRREMIRSNRTPEQVLADATWGAFQAGWEGPVGADADHLKTTEDIDLCAAAGFTFFTLDPGNYVDSQAETDSLSLLQEKAARLPCVDLETTLEDILNRYQDRTVTVESLVITLSKEAVLRAVVKYGEAVAHIVRLYRHLQSLDRPFELEISVDETDSPTTHAEHFFIASELKRLGVTWVSLAPRFVGRFEKGVEYLSSAGIPGDVKDFSADVKGHAAIARLLGPYKLSLHSGSDKFSVYPLIHQATRGLVHLKTAGTSYLEALRVIASLEPGLFREILHLARLRYDQDRASYHVSASGSQIPAPEELKDDQLPALLEDRATRQVLHVTFGSVLASLGPQLDSALRLRAYAYREALAIHFGRHLKPFIEGHS